MQSEIGGPGVATFTEGSRRLIWDFGNPWTMGVKDLAGEWVYRSAPGVPQCPTGQKAAKVAREWLS
jgi:hypothetical protein